MTAKVYAAAMLGLQGQVVEVEVDFIHGLNNFIIVGLGDKAIQESKERIVSAIRNSGVDFIPKRIIVNLAPADTPKSGPAFDLPIALGYLICTNQIPAIPYTTAVLGELSLTGSVRPLAGILPVVAFLQRQGFQEVIVASDNAAEASLVTGIKITPVTDLNQVIGYLQGRTQIPEYKSDTSAPKSANYELDLSAVKGQSHAKRAFEIAAAGRHNILLSGVPGAGKTMLAKCLPGIMPELPFAESLAVTQIHSIAGQLDPESPLITARPFRSPHHTVSPVALIGGGMVPKPGEISLSHHGVLFLDELPEFPRPVLDALRQPLEAKQVNISRASYNVTFPADFMLVAAMNPCKCGFYGSSAQQCTCSLRDVRRYQQKISGPILDRIEIQVKIAKVDYQDLTSPQILESSQIVKSRVINATQFQHQLTMHKDNNNLEYLDASAKRNLELAIAKFSISGRGYTKLLKVARTIANLEQSYAIQAQHIAEALSYRFN